MAIILLSSDLMAASNIRGPAQARGVALTLRADPQAVLTRCEQEGVDLVLLDLSLPGLDVRQLVPRLRGTACPPKAILAFGPHVQSGWLEAAAEAGCDEVLTRGQFHAQAGALIQRYSEGRQKENDECQNPNDERSPNVE